MTTLDTDFKRNKWRDMGSNKDAISSTGYLQPGNQLIFYVEWRHLHRSAASNTGVGDAVHRWTDALVVRIGSGTERLEKLHYKNHEKLRVSANRPAGTPDTNTDPSGSSQRERRGQARGAEETEEKVGSFPRKESLLLRWTDHSGPAERGLAPHSRPYSGHKWIILYIWVSSCFIFGCSVVFLVIKVSCMDMSIWGKSSSSN